MIVGGRRAALSEQLYLRAVGSRMATRLDTAHVWSITNLYLVLVASITRWVRGATTLVRR